MTQHKRTGKSPEIPQNQFRTPKQPTTPATTFHSRSAKSKITPSPAVRTPATALKRGSIPPTRSQSTLTQIEFVAQPTHLDNDQLDYITEGQLDATHQRQESAQLDNGSESETDYRPPLRTRGNSTRFETNDDHPKRRRKANGMGNRAVDRGQSLRRGQTPKVTGAGKGKRKSMEKPDTKRDKTLTQMKFVRRYIPIDESDDNDTNMGYIETPQQDSTIEQGPAGEEEKTPKTNKRTAKPEPATSSKRNRRIFEQELDLSTGEPLTSGETQDTSLQGDQQSSLSSKIPFTPQKSRKLEIPSSQSPESPGLAIITSSQFRCATLSPTKRKPLNFRLQEVELIKEESPSAGPMIEDSQGPEGTSQLKTPTHISPNEPGPLVQEPQISADVAHPSLPETSLSSQEAPPADQGSNSQRIQRERTVVYETDADSSASESEDMEDKQPDFPRAQNPREMVSRLVEDSPRLPSDDSQELPLPETQPPGDMGFDPPSEPPDRVQPATQFPHEPIPTLNTQKLSELFPNEGNTQYPQHRALRPQNFPGPFSQSQSQSQEPDQTELIPESSPIREQQNSLDKMDHVFQRPRAPDTVVQVESSQPVRREESGPGNVLSRSQLLTSSVMESVALPNFWIGSQDSVGEPYSLPDE
ncbi:hypothetical protein N7481_006018 [Penicillium waksmanii]|uniref:uncharacterized protein n=1 Tax=Penicillium waksmanii TaxID=69791 RepID=UPI00254919B3|nr:uncharacterized protein N7481_006018 [Penicillium waksmanii]KAJ5983919.1 hypothetical protein N7481_006018 [Penicillium waksmanii]